MSLLILIVIWVHVVLLVVLSKIPLLVVIVIVGVVVLIILLHYLLLLRLVPYKSTFRRNTKNIVIIFTRYSFKKILSDYLKEQVKSEKRVGTCLVLITLSDEFQLISQFTQRTILEFLYFVYHSLNIINVRKNMF